MKDAAITILRFVVGFVASVWGSLCLLGYGLVGAGEKSLWQVSMEITGIMLVGGCVMAALPKPDVKVALLASWPLAFILVLMGLGAYEAWQKDGTLHVLGIAIPIGMVVCLVSPTLIRVRLGAGRPNGPQGSSPG